MNIPKEFLIYIKGLKDNHKLKIIDTHVHPFDVMGIIHQDYYTNSFVIYNNKENNYYAPFLMEWMKFNKLANILSDAAFNFLPNIVGNKIKSIYNNISKARILDEIEKSLVDKIVLLPVAPWLTVEQISKNFNSERFLILGSFDIHKIKIENIEECLENWIQKFKIIGLKLHPNLQNFKPQPSDNPKEIGEKLKLIYKLAEKRGLYLIFHGGNSNFTKLFDIRYGDLVRSKKNALLKNFCDIYGKSEIFGRYNIPIIIAHLGHFGINKINYQLVKIISKEYKNVFFDTAGVSPKFIQRFIDLVGSERIIFGSDAFYNHMIYNIYFIFLAAKNAKSKEHLDEMMVNILGRNFSLNIIRGK